MPFRGLTESLPRHGGSQDGSERGGRAEPAFQVALDILRCLIALFFVHRHALDDDIAECLRDFLVPFHGRDRALLNPLQEQSENGFGFKRGRAGQHLVKDNAKSVEVRTRVDFFTLGLLGRHVRRSAYHRSRGGDTRLLHGMRDAEIHHHHAASVFHHDVLGFQVAVYDTFRVRRGKRAAHLDYNFDFLFQTDRDNTP